MVFGCNMAVVVLKETIHESVCFVEEVVMDGLMDFNALPSYWGFSASRTNVVFHWHWRMQ